MDMAMMKMLKKTKGESKSRFSFQAAGRVKVGEEC